MKTLRHLLAALLPLFVLAACGGGGGDDSDDTPQPATVAIAGRVVDTDGLAVSGVDVRLGNATARTDASGNYTLELSAQPPAAGDAPAVVTFRKSGYIEQVQRTAYPSRTAQRVDTVITDLAVFKFIGGRLTLVEVMPGATLEQVRATTSASFDMALT